MEKFEERIFDIMNKHYDSDHPANSFLRSAKEIAQIAYPVAFVEWKDENIIIDFLRENNWLNLEDEDNATGVVKSYLKAYSVQEQPLPEISDEEIERELTGMKIDGQLIHIPLSGIECSMFRDGAKFVKKWYRSQLRKRGEKAQQRQKIIELMQEDEGAGLYEPPEGEQLSDDIISLQTKSDE